MYIQQLLAVILIQEYVLTFFNTVKVSSKYAVELTVVRYPAIVACISS